MSVAWTARYGGLVGILMAYLASAVALAQPSPSPAPAGLVVGGVMDPQWTAALDVVAGTAPVADESAAYVVTRASAVVAVDLASGAPRWRADTVPTVAPAAAGGLAFLVVPNGIRALDSTSGTLAWERSLDGAVAVTPGIGAERLWLSLVTGDLVALRAVDGAVLWRTALGAAAAVTPTAHADRVYVASADGRVVAVEATTGTLAWTRDLEGRVTGLLPLAEEVLVGTSRALVSLDRRTGRPRWRWRLGTPVAGSPAADDRHIYVVGFDHLLRALDRRSGNLRWRRTLPHRPAGGPLLAGGAVLVPSLSTEIPTFAAATGEPGPAIATTSEVGSALYFLGAARATATRLLAVTTAGELVAFKSRIEPAPTPLAALPGVAVQEPPAPQPPPPPAAPLRR